MLRDASNWERFDDGDSVEPAVEHRVIRSAPRLLARGSLACPACDLPVLAVAPLSVTASIECPFCNEADAVRRFLRLDTMDTAGNEVHVRARLPSHQ